MKPQDKKPQDKKPQDKKPQDKKPQDKKPQDKKPQDKKPQDKKPQDKRSIDWSSMTPNEVYEALKSAPKLAGPWEPSFYSDKRCCRRRTLLGRWEDPETHSIWKVLEDGSVKAYFDGGDGCFSSVEEARTKIDARLQEAGWVFVDTEDL